MKISRRKFLGMLGVGTTATATMLTGCKNKMEDALRDEYIDQVEPPVGKMTMRTNPTTGDKVSLLGYGMMRLPVKEAKEEGPPQHIAMETPRRAPASPCHVIRGANTSSLRNSPTSMKKPGLRPPLRRCTTTP